jgi:hypothetical protein
LHARQIAFIAAATEAGVEAIVRISTASVLIALDSTGVYAKAHAKIEQYIAEHKSKVKNSLMLMRLSWVEYVEAVGNLVCIV